MSDKLSFKFILGPGVNRAGFFPICPVLIVYDVPPLTAVRLSSSVAGDSCFRHRRSVASGYLRFRETRPCVPPSLRISLICRRVNSPCKLGTFPEQSLSASSRFAVARFLDSVQGTGTRRAFPANVAMPFREFMKPEASAGSACRFHRISLLVQACSRAALVPQAAIRFSR
jgi:hypothetical protein